MRRLLLNRWVSAACAVTWVSAAWLLPEQARAQVPNDPSFHTSGSWGQPHADQWGLQRIGLDAVAYAKPAGPSVVVAVIDSGIDYTHPELPVERLWRNTAESLNGIDDDRNGYIDDVVGWNFADSDNTPWDRAGHGTHVAGVIAAATNNGMGIAGIAPGAQAMPLKVLNFIGRGRSAHIAAAIHYAIANGAKVINLSLGGEHLSTVEERAIRAAHAAGIVTVLAAGNEGREIVTHPLSDVPSVLLVAATDTNDRRARFSNWGRVIDVAAPGMDILSLRARDTDLVRFSGAAGYKEGAASVGTHLYRASGTSFAAAFVSGLAARLRSERPELTGVQVARLIAQTARDAEAPGVDALTGYGIIDAKAALAGNPATWIEARIDGIDLSVRDGETRIRVLGTADADRLVAVSLRAAPERYPHDWVELAKPLAAPVRSGVIAEFEPRLLRGARRWTLQLAAIHENGQRRESRFIADLGGAP